MGDMKDQYDDGRYDPVRQDGAYDPRDDAVVFPGGWHVPAHMAPEPFFVPITAPRGGIKYPTPTKLKGTPVLSHKAQLTVLKNKQENLAAEIANLERKIKLSRPAPPATQKAWSIRVRFTSTGTVYTYLILRHGQKFYTTGTNVQDSAFPSWDAVLEWLDGMNEHGPLVPLIIDATTTPPLAGRAQ